MSYTAAETKTVNEMESKIDAWEDSFDGFMKCLSNKLGSLTAKVVKFNSSSITLADNTIFIYNGSAGITNLDILYPSGNFISTILFSTAKSGTIKVTFPGSTKFAGSAPYEFFPGENWELNIFNGRVAGSQLY